LLEEIVLYQGQVLDGRRRQAACIRAGVKPLYRDFGSRASDGFGPLDWAFTVNFQRRDLSKGERALCAARYANMKRGYNQNSSVNGKPPVSQREAAEKFGADRGTVERAARVLKGVPELEQAVLAETVSVSDAAAIAGEDPKLQREALEAVQAGEAKTLKEAVRTVKGRPPTDRAALCRALEEMIEQLAGVDLVCVRSARGHAREARDARDQARDSLKAAQASLGRLCKVLGS
jgi:ParB-like chromosome segregation protein Spo0J